MRAVWTILVWASIASVAVADDAPSNISWEADEAIFPDGWTRPPFLGQAAPINAAEKPRAERLIKRELAKYPAGLLEKVLQNVYLLDELTFFETQQFSGTASARDVYLVVRSERQGYTDHFVAARFHAEFSTLLLNRYLKQFDQEAWQAVHPEDFAYLGCNSWDGLQAKDGGSVAIDEGAASIAPSKRAEDLELGFLTEYSRSSVENDFNEYAAALFLNQPEFRELARRYAGVAGKRALAIRFYNALDPALTPEYFDQLEPARQ